MMAKTKYLWYSFPSELNAPSSALQFRANEPVNIRQANIEAFATAPFEHLLSNAHHEQFEPGKGCIACSFSQNSLSKRQANDKRRVWAAHIFGHLVDHKLNKTPAAQLPHRCKCLRLLDATVLHPRLRLREAVRRKLSRYFSVWHRRGTSSDINKQSLRNVYKNLPGETSIRLLTLLPSRDSGARLQCTIETVPDNASRQYEAVSYVWGEAAKPCHLDILYEDSFVSVQVTPNLHAALRRFRHHRRPRTLWVDSVCINQNDNKERNHQVRLMGNIYRNASRVLIWLGEHRPVGPSGVIKFVSGDVAYPSGTHDHLEDFLAYIGSQTAHFDWYNRRPGRWLSLESLDIGYRLQDPDDSAELGLARRRRYAVEGKGLSYRHLNADTITALNELWKSPYWLRAWTWQESFLATERMFFFGDMCFPDSTLIKALASLHLDKIIGRPQHGSNPLRSQVAFMLVNHSLLRRTKQDLQGYVSLLTLLATRRGALCKFPSDLIYSLLGAAIDSPDIAVDYDQPFEETFARLVGPVIQSSKSLKILGLKEAPPHDPILPTWVPDWRRGGQTLALSPLFAESHYTATMNLTPEVQQSPDGRTLTVTGVRFDRITEMHNIDGNLFQWLRRKCTSTEWDSGSHRYPGEGMWRSMIRTLFHDLEEFDLRPSAGRWSQHSWNVYNRYGYATDDWLFFFPVRSMPQSWKSKTDQRVVFVTGKGRLGTAPKHARVGNTITLLFGGAVPIALRQQKGRANNFTLVGECYVHGAMDGEGLAEVRREQGIGSDWSEDKTRLRKGIFTGPRPQTEDFTLH